MQIAKVQLDKFLKNYNVGKLIGYQTIDLGLMNKILLLKTTERKYILKILIQNNSGNKLNYELDLLNYLHDLPTPKPIVRKDLKYWSFFGKNKAFLMSLMPGEHKKIITDEDLKNVGAFLAKMHIQSLNFKSYIRRPETLSHSEDSLKKIFLKCKSIKDRRVVRALSYIQQNIFLFLPPKNIIYGAIHSDLKPENCLFKKNELSGVVDFDNSYIAPLIIDLTNTIIWFCTKSHELDTKRAKIIIGSYQTSRKLKTAEKAYLPKAIHFVYLRNVLRGIEFYTIKKVKKDLVYWSFDNFLTTEQKLPNVIRV